MTLDWNNSLTALLVIGSIRWLNEAASRRGTAEPFSPLRAKSFVPDIGGLLLYWSGGRAAFRRSGDHPKP